MFTYLQGKRPTGRRNGSSPTLPSQQTSFKRNFDSSVPSSTNYHGDRSPPSDLEVVQSTSASSSNPYTLPPIPRVASHHDSHIDMLSSEDDSPDTMFQHMESKQDIESLSRHNGRISSWVEDRVDKTETERTELKVVPVVTEPSSQPSQLPLKSVRPYRNLLRSYTGPFSPSRESLVGASNQDQQSPNLSSIHPEQPSSSAVSQVRSGKMKLNLLNPMSLLARRRSTQAGATNNVLTLSRNVSGPPMKLPDDYDPRIRGNVVHDFSAPRSSHQAYSNHGGISKFAKIVSVQSVYQMGQNDEINLRDTQNPSAETDNQDQAIESSTPSDRAHTPIFKEHFGLESEPWQFDKGDRRNQQTRSIMDHVPEMNHSDRDISPLPLFARRLPEMVSNSLDTSEASPAMPFNGPLEVVSEDDMLEPKGNISIPASPISPPKTRSRATSTTDSTFQPVGLPKHFKSNSSRFSFDLAGVGSAAQEQLLEEKHRQQSAQKALVNSTSRLSIGTIGQDNDDDEGFFYDESEEFECLEEKIPGVNTDADDEDDFINHHNPEILKPISSEWRDVSPITPKSSNPEVVESSHNLLGETESSISPFLLSKTLSEDELPSLHSPFQKSQNSHLNELARGDKQPIYSNHSHSEAYEEDDLYFDDGMIDDIEDVDGQNFDESVFDDDTSRIYGLPLRDQKPLSLVLESPKSDTSQKITRPVSLDSGATSVHHQPNEPDAHLEQNSRSSLSEPIHTKSSVNYNNHSISYAHKSVSLTHDNLAAYHSALAHATNQAVLSGKFNRRSSVSSSEHELSPVEVDRHAMIFSEPSDENEGDFESHSTHNDTESFYLDDNIEDDSIIAAANAEALENDVEGFYGQEFGFFARATGSDEAEYVNGGYFGAVGTDGVRRSHSGRANFQEPSLTPITERSEWSTRNSVISLAITSAYSSPLQNAGLAQLTTDAIHFDEEHMSLSALMRLRRGAWGGSNVSLPSTASSHKSGSSQIYLPPIPSSGTPSYEHDGFHYTSSDHSLSSLTSIEESHSNSPTLKVQTQGLLINEIDKGNGPEPSPKRWNALRGGSGHSRNNSGAESVSYVKDVSEGSERWVLEKRRTFEGGKVEVLGREVVEGGRI